PLTRFLDPPSADPAAALEPVEHRIERRDVKAQHAGRSAVDFARDVVAMAWRVLDGGEHHQLCAALFEVIFRGHIWSHNIWQCGGDCKGFDPVAPAFRRKTNSL